MKYVFFVLLLFSTVIFSGCTEINKCNTPIKSHPFHGLWLFIGGDEPEFPVSQSQIDINADGNFHAVTQEDSRVILAYEYVEQGTDNYIYRVSRNTHSGGTDPIGFMGFRISSGILMNTAMKKEINDPVVLEKALFNFAIRVR